MKPARYMTGILLIPLIGGCGALVPAPERAFVEAQCRQPFEQLDARLEAAGLRDHGEYAIPDFPYLRSNRLLASFAGETDETLRLDTWLSHLAALDARARRLELLRLHRDPALAEARARQLDRCRDVLTDLDRHHPQRLAQLRQASQVPDDYLTHRRILGLYPVTALGIRLGIHFWHRQTHETFATPLDQLPLAGTLTYWSSPGRPIPDTRTLAHWLATSRDPLGIPWPDPEQQERLLEHYSPVWAVDVRGEPDRIARIVWQDGPIADTTRPAEYRLISHTRFGDQVLLQLNYLIWFPERPSGDMYAGWLDGIHWRVTLGMDGQPLIYDSIHPCGCYHLYFPTSRLQWRFGQPPTGLEEPPLAPQQAPAHGRLTVRIGHTRHYIERIDTALVQTAIPLETLPYDTLRALPGEDASGKAGWYSLFGRHGLVAGSERPERFLFWPMGIRSAGAMRQWGRQPSAFVGRRHFDEARLFETFFERREEE